MKLEYTKKVEIMDQKIWDKLAVDYDESVENNQNSIIINYLSKEIEILTILCKKICKLNKNCSIIDMGSGTGRIIFALDKNLKKYTNQFYGIEISEPMLNYANKKKNNYKNNSKIKFLKYDLTNLNLSKYFNLNETNIVICSYNTLGVIPFSKRKKFITNIKNIAGKKGLVLLTMFNGDNFSFVAPKLYNSMKPMIKQVNKNSFDNKNKIFKNNLGFQSQWFTKNEIKSMLYSNIEPIPIDIIINDISYTFGNVFVDRDI